MKKLYILLSFILYSSFIFSQIRFTAVDPTNGNITIKNFGSTSEDISALRFCHLFNYGTLSNLSIVTGDLNLAQNEEVTLSRPTLASSSDLGLFVAGSSSADFGDSSKMLDFLQWGSSGNGRESVAVSKGIWGASQFISTSAPYVFGGNGTDHGVTFWSTLSSNSLELKNITAIYPNPSNGVFSIASGSLPISNIKVYTISGKLVFDNYYNNTNLVNLNLDLKSGVYFVELSSNTIKKLVIY